MWINFIAHSPFAIKIYVGTVNAISGEPALETAATKQRRHATFSEGKEVQDYVVVPGQLWLDGIATDDGVVKQFIATRLGDGYTVEAQVTGEETRGGLQFEITPVVADTGTKRLVHVKTPSGKTIGVEITENTIGLGLKSKIEIKEDIPIDQQRLVCSGKHIQDGELHSHTFFKTAKC